MNKYLIFFVAILILLPLAGCRTSQGNTGQMQTFSFPQIEPDWIRDGQAIEFEGTLWYPGDGIETFLDSEVYMITVYKGVQVFIDRMDVRPYARLYTKFGKNKFRYFEKRDAK